MPVAGAHHGLHRDGHARLKADAVAGGPEVGHLGGLVELGAHAVAHKVPHHGAAVAFHVDLHRVGDVGHPLSHLRELEALPEALPGDIDEPLSLVRDLPAGVGGGAVAVEPIDHSPHVDADDVALLEDDLLGRNAVDDHLVHRDARRPCEPVIVQERRLSTAAADELAHRVVDLPGGDAWADHPARQRPGLGGDPPGAAHGVLFPGGLQGDELHAPHLPRVSATALAVASMVG